MKRISSLTELKAEQKRLRNQRIALEIEIKQQFTELKEEFEPLKIFTKSAGKLLSSKNNGMLSNSAGHLVEFLAKNIFLRNSGFIARMIIPFLAKNTTSNIVENNKPKIVDWISSVIGKFANKKTVQE